MHRLRQWKTTPGKMNTIMSRFTLKMLAVGFALLTLVAIPTHAAEPATLSLQPATVALEVDAGSAQSQTLRFTNRTSEVGAFRVQLIDYQMAADGETLEFLPVGSAQDSLFPFLAFEPTSFELEPGATQDILMTVRPPETQVSGRYRGALFIGTDNLGTTDDAQLSVSGKVGSVIGVTVNGSEVTTTLQQSGWVLLTLAVVALCSFWVIGSFVYRRRSIR